MRALAAIGMLLLAASSRAAPDRDLCAPGAMHHGVAIDLDVTGADIRDMFRLLADAGHFNLVVPDDVDGKVTLRLQHVAWDAAACAIAGLHHLTITIRDGIVLVTRADRPG